MGGPDAAGGGDSTMIRSRPAVPELRVGVLCAALLLSGCGDALDAPPAAPIASSGAAGGAATSNVRAPVTKAPRQAIRFDWNFDGREDIAWQNRATGAGQVWRMNGTTIIGSGESWGAGAAFDVVSLRARLIGSDRCQDFVESSGDTLLLWDRVFDALLNTCTDSPSRTYAARHSAAGWRLFAVDGNYDGSPNNQALWRNAAGTVAIWKFGANGVIAEAGFPATAPNEWTLVDARGDYDGDGRTDVLWQNEQGVVAMWRMTDIRGVAGASFFGAAPRSQWSLVEGAGDYDGDGRSDLLWLSNSGAVVIWFLDPASQRFTAASVGTVGPGIRVLDGTSDFNGDGRSDLVLQDAAGVVTIWLMSGAQIVASASLGAVGSEWRYVNRRLAADATTGGTGGTGGNTTARAYIRWNGNANGEIVKDANNEDFAFYADTRCIYSFARRVETTNFCLGTNPAYAGVFAGLAVHVQSARGTAGGCIAVLATPEGLQVDIFTDSAGIQTVRALSTRWDTTGC
jgi:hypothetical protein